MQTFKEYLAERVVSIGFNKDQEHLRDKHRDEIHHILQKSYQGVEGGYSGLGSGTKEESDAIHHDISHSMIKATKRDGKITSVNLYKDRFGRKSIASGTDGSEQGKKDYIKNKTEDNTQKRSWGEASGKAEHIARKVGNPVVPARHAAKLTGKDDVRVHADGERYTRRIGKEDHDKVILGHPKM